MHGKKREKSLFSFNFFSPSKEKAGEEARKSGKFLALTFASLLVLYLLSGLIPLEFYELFVANTALNAYEAFGVDGQIVSGEPVGVKLSNGVNMQISYLCIGLLEMLVLASVIIASAGIPINKRIIGVFVGLIGVQVVNFARIFATVHFALVSDANTVEFIHNIFFRVTLFVTIFVFYAAWFRWATGKKSKK